MTQSLLLNKSVVLLVLLITLLSSIVTALPNIIYVYEEENSTSINASIIINQPATYSISVKNNGTFDIANLTCYDIPFFNCSTIPLITINNEEKLLFTITSQNIFDLTTYTINTHFLYLDPFIIEPTNNNIIINNVSLQENPYSNINITVYSTDSITWSNNDSVEHTVTFIQGSITNDVLIQPNNNYTQLFTEIEQLEYYDKKTGKNAYIIVRNNTQYFSIHNEAYDAPFKVSLTSNYAPTQIETTLFTNEFLIDHDERINGVFQIHNMMEQPAYNVRFTINDLFPSQKSFYPENKITPFDLHINETIIVLFTIIPDITNAEQTGKTYNASLLVSADNINTSANDLFVSVNFFDLFTNNTVCYGSEYWLAKTAYCNQFPQSRDCLIAPLENNITIIEYREPANSANFSESEIRNALLDRPLCNEIMQRLSNNFQEVIVASNNVSERVSLVENEFARENDALLNHTLESNSKLQYQLRLWQVAPLYVLLIIGFIIVIIFFFIKKSKERKLGVI